jgi:hypothetical protein
MTSDGSWDFKSHLDVRGNCWTVALILAFDIASPAWLSLLVSGFALMQSSTFRLARRITGYVVGSILIVWGLIGFLCEFEFPAQWDTKFVYSGNSCCGVMILYGAILILATYHHYAGGIWTFLGTAFVGISMMFVAMPIDAYLTGALTSRLCLYA